MLKKYNDTLSTLNQRTLNLFSNKEMNDAISAATQAIKLVSSVKMISPELHKSIEDESVLCRDLMESYAFKHFIDDSIRPLRAVIWGIISDGNPYGKWMVYCNPYIHVIDLFIGMSIAKCIDEEKNNNSSDIVLSTLLELLAVGIIVIAQFVMPYHMPWLMPSRFSIYLIIMSILVYVFSKQRGLLSIRNGEHPVLR